MHHVDFFLFPVLLIEKPAHSNICWKNTWLGYADVADAENRRSFVEFGNSDDEWFSHKNYSLITNFCGSREEWAANRARGLKSGELEKWLRQRELGIVTPRNGSRIRAKKLINQYTWYWPIATDIAKSTYAHGASVTCPCVVKDGWIDCDAQCAYRKKYDYVFKQFQRKKRKTVQLYVNLRNI